jgi:HD superfamily phosphohydrolase
MASRKVERDAGTRKDSLKLSLGVPMLKVRHEVRDCLYGFVEFDDLEKALLDSMPFQRLRSIHQLAMCYQVYPGATHKRFEHSLGVMEMASRIFDRIFNKRLADPVHDRIAHELELQELGYWKRIVRLSALLHDIGHLPFSHAAEEALLPEGWNHERITAEIIRESEIQEILRKAKPPVEPEDVIDVCWDIRKRAKTDPKFQLTPWKTVLNEIITGNTFGADRIDYLLRDSWHAGVGYGRFDHQRLIDGLKLAVDPSTEEITVALEHGSIHAAEALLLGRYFMYTQVYFHNVRRVYDLHLKEFLQAWLPDGKFSKNWKELLKVTDYEILTDLAEAASNEKNQLHSLAKTLICRKHFRTIYEQMFTHKRKRPEILQDLTNFAVEAFGKEKVRQDSYSSKSERNDFWVMPEHGSMESSLEVSEVISRLPPVEIGLLFVAPEVKEMAENKIKMQLKNLLSDADVDYSI